MELFEDGCTELSLHSLSHCLFLLVLIPGLGSSNLICTHVLFVLAHGFLNYKYCKVFGQLYLLIYIASIYIF